MAGSLSVATGSYCLEELSLNIGVGIRRLAGIGGSTALVLDQLRYLAAGGHRCDVFGESLDARAVQDAGARPVRLWRQPGSEYYSRRSFARRAQRRIDRGDYSLVIGHGDLLKQDVLFVHNLVEREQELLAAPGPPEETPIVRLHRELFGGRGFRQVIANSRLARRDLLDRYGLDPAIVQVAYPGFDRARFNDRQRPAVRRAARDKLGLDDQFLLAFITSGNFPLRGADILRDTLLALPESLRVDCRVLAVGAAHNTRSLQKDFAAAGLADCLLARERRSDVEFYYAAADLLLHPARLETFGLVVVEAAACGTPVLTSRAVGAAELLPAGAELEQPAADGFAAQLVDLMENRQKLAELAKIQSQAVQAYDWPGYHARWFELASAAGAPAR
jgi:UDP-glucose:(heptosyl)LPS alpha-1,3-glucosyltransferase